MNNAWFEIKWHFRYNWMFYVIAIVVVMLSFGFWYIAGVAASQPRPPVVITQQAEGTIINIRATGAWENWCKVELKFDDGTVLLASYSFIRKYNIREGRRYSIIDNSYYGRVATEMETDNEL